MIGILVKFLEFMKLENEILKQNTPNQALNSNQAQSNEVMIERDEKDNVFCEKSKIVTHYENGKAIKVQITTQLIPVSKTSAIQKTSVQRLERGI